MHVRKATAFSAEEIEYLATFPLITFEKTTGRKDSGSTEKGTVRAAKAVKALNPKTKILYYRNILVHYGCEAFLSSPDPWVLRRALQLRQDGYTGESLSMPGLRWI